MRLADIGENKILRRLREFISKKNLLPDDDSSAMIIEELVNSLSNSSIVVNTDGFVESTDAPLGMMPIHYGEKVAHMTLSDIFVKGVQPIGFLLSASIPKNDSFIKLYEIVEGAVSFCKKFDVAFLGGDLNESKDLVLDGFAFGFSPEQSIIPRRGAKKTNLIVTIPWFGYASIGLNFLLSQIDIDLSSELLKKSVKEVYSPTPWFKEFMNVKNLVKITSSIDSSDGLAKSLNILAKQNNSAIAIHTLPLADELKNAVPKQYHFMFTMFGGEEFIPIFTIPKKEEKDLPEPFIVIGKLTRNKGPPKVYFENENGKKQEIPDKGWSHFI